MKSLTMLIALSGCLFLTFPGRAQSPVVISEFMADNTRTLFDEDGDSEDWIEIHNVASTNVNLDGWSLTDSAGNRTKWRFPATNLNAGAAMVVFASNKDRRVPGRTLHTNFRLDPDGEYLALVQPDGTNIATAFAPRYPRQVPNVSFGFGLISSNITLVGTGAAVRVLVPTAANGGDLLADAWKGTNEPFADGAWRSGVSGVGFSAANAPSLVAATSVVVRFNFDAPPVGTTIADSKPSGALLNGVNNGAAWVAASADEAPTPVARGGVMQFVAQENDQITLPSNAALNSARGAIVFWMRSLGAAGIGDGPGVLFDRRVGSAAPPTPANGALILQELDGRITFQAFSNGPVANSFSSAVSTADDRWHHIAIVYNQSPTGAVVLYIDGALQGTVNNVRGWSWPASQQIELGRSHEVEFRKYGGLLDDFRLYNRTLNAAEVVEIYNGDGGVPASEVGTNIEADMLGVNASAFIRIPFTVADPNAFSLLTLRVRHNDGFTAWINGQPVGSANAPDPLAWNATATAVHASSFPASIVFNPFILDEESFLSTNLFKAGVNILAIQGLNVTANDPTFLVLPELIAASVPIETTNGVYFTQPTAGEPNTRGTAIPGPIITDVEHTPNVPLTGQTVRVTAKVTPSFNAVTNITLRYRVMYSNEVSLPMSDTGANGDVVAGDGIFSALIPSSAVINKLMLRYIVTARDNQGNQSRWPLFYSPTNSAEYLGTVVNPDYVTSKLPIYYIFMQTPGGAENNTGTRGSFFYDGEFYDNVQISFRGNSSAGFVKKAHRLEFNRDHRLRHSPDYPRIGDTSLLGEFSDPTYFRQMLSFWLANAMGVPAPFSYPVRVETNGGFWQLALHSDVMGEEQLARLGYDPNGALYKAVGQFRPTFESTGVFEKKTRRFEDRSDYVEVATGINEARPLATRATNIFDMFDVPNVINYLTVARWVQEADDVWANMTVYRDTLGDKLWRVIPFDMNVSWGQLYCGDSPSSFNAIIATNDNFKSHPLYGGSTILPTTGGANWNRLYDAIVMVPETRQMLLRRMRTLLDTFMQPPETHPLALQLERRVSAFTNLIWVEAFLDRQKHGWPNGQANYCYGNNQYITNHVPDTVNQYFGPRRRHWYVTHSITNTAKPIGISSASNAGIPLGQPVDAAVSITAVEFNPSSGNQQEEYIAITNANPYAVDISDWKLGGGVDFTFKGGTVIPSNKVVYVSPNTLAFRSRSAGPRGGLALFSVGPYQGQLSARGEPLTITDNHGRLVYSNSFVGSPSLAQQFLRVTEIMYNPSLLAGSATDPQEFEYIELKNISASTSISLTGVRFINGVLFDFTDSSVTSLGPSQRVLVVKNSAAFTARYGAANIAGQYTGSLDNAGERIQLVDAANEEILDFSYNNSWYRITDGFGFSLVIANENGEPDLWDQKTGWHPSGVVNGAPGQDDPPAVVFAPIIINEVLTHTDPPLVDAVELFNPTADSVNIGGWFITDDFNTPKKYRIANGTMIAAGGYLVFDETQFNTPPNTPTSFSFSSLGDEAYVFSGDANTNLTGYFFGYEFGAAEADTSFGRYTNSVGDVHLVAQAASTLGGPNSAPKIGPVVISEIMYRPADLAGGEDNSPDEYIELHNRTAATVSLYDPAASTNTWRLRGGVDFDFPANVSLAANGFLLVVNFDPADAAALAAFRNKFNVPQSAGIYGPYQGGLNNAADEIELRRPDMPEGDAVPYITIDRVEYSDQAPWPVFADGTGASLHRLNVSQYGNDPINWTAAAPDPGSAPAGGTAPVITVQPAGGNAIATASASLNVTATGSAPLRYQWRANGANIFGGTNAVLTISDVQVENSGLYDVVVFNSAGVTVSSNTALNVLFSSYIFQHPRNVAGRPGTNALFSVVATSGSPIRYQWRHNGVNVPGATSSSLTVADAQLEDAGFYDVMLTDDIGSVTSSAAKLTILIDPVIIQQPLSQQVVQGGSLTFSVTVTNTATLPIGFRWRRQGGTVAFEEGNSYTGFYTATNIQPGLTNFTVVATNQARMGGSLSVSAFAFIVPDSDGDGLPNDWETANGLNPNNSGDRNTDSDGDSMTNAEEYIAGTDPQDEESYLKVDRIGSGQSATIEFLAISNRTYSVQFTDDLTSAAWSSLADIAARTTNHTEVVVDTNPGPARFYRLATPQQP